MVGICKWFLSVLWAVEIKDKVLQVFDVLLAAAEAGLRLLEYSWRGSPYLLRALWRLRVVDVVGRLAYQSSCCNGELDRCLDDIKVWFLVIRVCWCFPT